MGQKGSYKMIDTTYYYVLRLVGSPVLVATHRMKGWQEGEKEGKRCHRWDAAFNQGTFS